MAGQQHSGDGGDNMMAMAIALAGIVLLAMVFAKPLHTFVWSVLGMEASAVSVASPILTEPARQNLERWKRRLAQPPPVKATAETMVTALTIGGSWLRWPILVVFGFCGIWLILRSPTFRYSRTLDYESLLLEQSIPFVRIRPTLWLKGRMTAVERGNYWRALSPYEFAQSIGAIVPNASATITEASWRAEKAAASFALQLGTAPLPASDDAMLSISAMAYHEQLLFAAFAARVIDKKKASDDLLDGIAIGFGPHWSTRKRLVQRLRGRSYADWPSGGPWVIRLSSRERTLLASILREAAASKEIQHFLSAHAFVRTLLPALLDRAQTVHGILTTSDFRWIKAVDRPLHFALNDVGRRVASAEASGVRSHMQAELDAGHRLPAPHVEAAVDALRIHLDESSWQAPPLVDVSKFTVAAQDAAASIQASLERSDIATEAALAAGQGGAAANG
ncbi:MAG: hypothetical protein ABIW82_17090 [Dokdonella sp.]